MSNNPMMSQMNQGMSQMPNNQMNQFMQQQQQATMLQQQQQQAMLAQQQQAMMQQAMQQQAMMQQAMLAQQQQAMMQQAVLAQQQKMAQMQTILNKGNNADQSPNTAQFGSSQIVQPQGNGISVIFRTSGQNAPQRPPISINKADDHDQTKKFIFNAKNLNPSLTLSAAGIAHNSNIFVVTTKGVQGAI